MSINLRLVSVVVGVMGLAVATPSAAEQASATFTWSGTVPMAPISNGFIIKDSIGNDIKRGTLVFDVDDKGLGILTSASTINFNVYAFDGTVVGEPASSYDYQLTSVMASKGGIPQEQDDNGYYTITANGTPMVVGAQPSSKASGGVTLLSVTPSANGIIASLASNRPTSGESVDVHARIVISGAV